MDYTQYAQLFTFAMGLVGALLTSGWVAASYLNRKFGDLHDTIDDKIESLEKNIVHKLEYHERHDDDRFAEIRNAVWDIRLRNAARDRDIPTPTKS